MQYILLLEPFLQVKNMKQTAEATCAQTLAMVMAQRQFETKMLAIM